MQEGQNRNHRSLFITSGLNLKEQHWPFLCKKDPAQFVADRQIEIITTAKNSQVIVIAAAQ